MSASEVSKPFLARGQNNLSDTVSGARNLHLNKFTYKTVLESDLEKYKACPRDGWRGLAQPHLPLPGSDTPSLLLSI